LKKEEKLWDFIIETLENELEGKKQFWWENNAHYGNQQEIINWKSNNPYGSWLHSMKCQLMENSNLVN
jgi:hypothetical protein